MSIGKTIVIVGHYGSGKTEFAANFTLFHRDAGHDTTLADLDIVNPYFRSRELQAQFEKRGIRVLSSNFETEHNLDTPALAAGLYACFQPGATVNIVDVGGDPVGARVLARYAHYLRNREYDMWMVINANRPQTAHPAETQRLLEQIEQISHLKINGLINNTHMLDETAPEDLLRGDALVRTLSASCGIPVKYTVCTRHLIPQAERLHVSGTLFPISLLLRPSWLS